MKMSLTPFRLKCHAWTCYFVLWCRLWKCRFIAPHQAQHWCFKFNFSFLWSREWIIKVYQSFIKSLSRNNIGQLFQHFQDFIYTPCTVCWSWSFPEETIYCQALVPWMLLQLSYDQIKSNEMVWNIKILNGQTLPLLLLCMSCLQLILWCTIQS